mgnify:CR=1 FL=1
MIEKPLYGNPLAGGALFRPQENQLQGDALVEQMQMRMQQRDVKTPAFLAYFKDVMDTKGYPTKTMEEYGGQFPNPLTERIVTQEDGMNLSGSNVPLSMLNVTPPSVPVSEQTPMSGLPPINNFLDDTRDKTLPQISDPAGLRNAIRTVDPIYSGDNSIASTQTVNPFQEQFTGFQNQLTSFGDQFSTLGDRLTKLEEGIASLLNRNMSSNFNSMQPAFGHSRYGYSPFSMVGLGSLFGGYYG